MQKETRLLVIVSLIFVLIRLLFLQQYAQNNPFYTHPVLDSAFYLSWAHAIVQGRPFFTEAYHHPPGYAFFLATIQMSAGDNPFAVLFLQTLMLAIQGWILFFISKRLFGERSAWLSFLLFSLCGPILFYSMKILSETLFCTLLVVSFYLLVRYQQDGKTKDFFLAGLFWGAAVEVRGTALIYFVVFLIPLIGKRKSAVVALAAGAALCIAPVLIRNQMVTGQPTAVAANWGENFYMANNAAATGTFSTIPGVRANLQQQIEDVRTEASKRSGKSLTSQQAQRYWFGQALAFITTQPGSWLRLEGRKFRKLFSWNEASTIYFYDLESNYFQPALKLFFVNYGLVIALFFAGLAFLPSTRSAALPLTFIVCHSVLMLIFWPELRFLLPAIPFLLLVAGTIARLKINRKLAPFALAGIILSLGLNLIPDRGTAGREAWFANVASAFIDNQEFPRAEDMARQSIQTNPGYADGWVNLGVALWAQGRREEAREAWRKALSLRPNDPVATKNLKAAEGQ